MTSFERSRRVRTSSMSDSIDASYVVANEQSITDLDSKDHMVDDEFEMEDDKRRIIQQLTEKYPDFDSLKTQDPMTSLSETLLEFELEKMLKQKRSLIQQRASQHLNMNVKQSISYINDMDCDYKEYRKRRMSEIDTITERPQVKFPRSKCKRNEQEVALAVEKRNSKQSVTNLIKDHYDTWLKNLRLKKYKLMHRWQRFNHRIESIEKTEEVYHSRLNRIDKYMDFGIKRKAELEKVSQGVQSKINTLEEQDFQIYLRNTVMDFNNKRRLDMFFKKIQWISFSERQNLFHRAFDSIPSQDQGCPTMTLSLIEVESQLEELKHCFDLTQAYDDNGQEFLFRVSKRFSAVFNAQTESWNFSPYPFIDSKNQNSVHSHERLSTMIDGEGNVVNSTSGMEVIYLKPETWINHIRIKPRIPTWQDQQTVFLRSMGGIDVSLSVEAAFLQSSDLLYATKRLKEQAESHPQRALVKKMYDNNNGIDMEEFEIEGGKITSNKLSAVHLLRYIRIREFRRKLLDIMNYFRSVERRLTMDSYGTSHQEHDASFIKRFFMDPTDLKIHTNSTGNFEVNRDDVYYLNNKKDLIIMDSFNMNIMYDISLEDLQQLEDRLLRIGTHFISKNIDSKREDVQIDRTLVLEDLYESETWFQDSKRKLVDCYLEAYEHCQDFEDQAKLGQIIVDIIHSQPNVDFSSYYFSESYASEIISLELLVSLLKDITKFQMREERLYVKDVLNNQTMKPQERMSDPGLPDEFQPASDSRLIRIFPGCVPVAPLDFYSSLSHLSHLHDTIQESVNDIVDSFHIENSISIASLRRTIIQQAIVEWKLLTKEEKIHKDLRLRMEDSRANIEETVLLEHPDNFLHLLRDVISDEEKLGNGSSSLHLGREDPTLTEGGFDITQKDSISCQVYSNAIELLLIWKNLIDQLYETDILSTVYTNQANLAGFNLSSTSLRPIDFDELDSEQQQERNTEPIALNAHRLCNLAMSEFDHKSADFNLSSLSGVKKVLHRNGLDSLRQAFQFQIAHRIVLDIAVRYNQIPIDEFYVASNFSNFFITSTHQKDPRDINRSSSMSVKVLKDIFFDINVTKHIYQKRALEQYQRVSSDKMTKGARPTMIRKRLRELKFKLYDDYCRSIVTSAHSYVLKYDIINICNEFRPLISQMREDSGFTLGQEDHLAIKHLMAMDGQIINPLYIPHYMQIINLQFGDLHNEDEELEDDLSVQYLTRIYDILERGYILTLFTAFHLQMTHSESTTNLSVWSLEPMANFSKRLESELNHLRQPNNAQSICQFLSMKCDLLFEKTLLTLRNLEKKFSLSDHHLGISVIQAGINRLLSLDHKSKSLFWKYWPAVQYLPAEKQGNYSTLLETEEVIYENRLPFQYLKNFLHTLADADRNYYSVEEMNIDLLLEDLLQEEGLYSTSNPERSTQVQIEFLEQSVVIFQLKDRFIELSVRDMQESDKKDPRVLEDLFNISITRKAKRLYDKEIKIREVLIQQRDGSQPGFQSKNELNAKRRRETDFRKKQMTVLIQEINKIMINDSINEIQSECNRITGELRETHSLVTNDSMNFGYDGKERIFHDFVTTIMSRGVRTRNKLGETEVTMFESDLDLAMDLVGQKIVVWQETQVNEISKNALSMIEHLKKQCFNLEMKLQHNQYFREVEKKSFKRRIQSELADKNYDLVFRVDSLTRENNELREELSTISEKIRKEEQAKYEELVTKLQKEIILTKGQFSEYKRQMYKEMQKKFSEVKENALMDITNYKGPNSSFSTKAIEIVMEENSIADLKMRIEDLKASRSQMKVLFKLKLLAQESKYLKQIRQAELEKETVKKRFFGNTEQIEAREQMLRKELVKTQEQLSNTEMEVEQLKKDLQLQIKNKQKLVSWKVKNAQLLDELEDKVDKYERWNQFDVDKLVLELEKTKKEVQQHNRIKEKLDKKAQMIEIRSQKTMEQLQKKLQREQQLKRSALSKLNTAREMHENDAENADWQKRYLDTNTELQYTQRELDILRDYLEVAGVEMPDSEIQEGSSHLSRPSSATTIRSLSARTHSGKQSNIQGIDLKSSSRPSSRNGMNAPAYLNRPMSLKPTYNTVSRPSSASSTKSGRRSSVVASPMSQPVPLQRPSTTVGQSRRERNVPILRRTASAGVSRPNAQVQPPILIAPHIPTF